MPHHLGLGPGDIPVIVADLMGTHMVTGTDNTT